jgi:hypothetical protein
MRYSRKCETREILHDKFMSYFFYGVIWKNPAVIVYGSFTTTCAINASRSGLGVQHYVMKFISDLRQVGGFLWVLRFSPPIKLTATI